MHICGMVRTVGGPLVAVFKRRTLSIGIDAHEELVVHETLLHVTLLVACGIVLHVDVPIEFLQTLVLLNMML